MNQPMTEFDLLKVAIDPDILATLGENIYNLQITLPMNNEGLPLRYVDAQKMLESGVLEGELDIDIISGALVDIDYSEGYAIVAGMPFWERLEGEPIPYYDLFKIYLHQRDTQATRSFLNVQDKTNVSITTVNHLAKAFHWRVRARAYDIYKHMELQNTKKKMIDDLESDHSKKAQTLIELAEDYWPTEECETLMNPKTALEMFQAGIKLKRLSLGLHPDQPFVGGGREEGRNVINIGIQQGGTITNNSGNSSAGATPVKDLATVIAILKAAGALTDVPEIIDADVEEVV